MTICISKMPPEFKFITDPSTEEIRQIKALYRITDWWDPMDDEKDDLVQRIVRGSHCFLAAFEGERIVGMGRAISDGVNDAYLQDITVLPELHHRGIGTQLVEKIVARLRQDGLRWIGLIAGSNSHPFYNRLGFEAMPFSMPMLFKEG